MRLAFWKKKDPNKKKKPVWREWVDALVFAVVAATIIRTLFIEAYTIPTGSMEGSLLVNDYLFVSKMAYGPRIPMTPVAVPLVHNTMPLVGGKSYTDAVQWKYRRWPGFGKVQRVGGVVLTFRDFALEKKRPGEERPVSDRVENLNALRKITVDVIEVIKLESGIAQIVKTDCLEIPVLGDACFREG